MSQHLEPWQYCLLYNGRVSCRPNLGVDGVGSQQHRGLGWTVNLLLEDLLLHLRRGYQIWSDWTILLFCFYIRRETVQCSSLEQDKSDFLLNRRVSYMNVKTTSCLQLDFNVSFVLISGGAKSFLWHERCESDRQVTLLDLNTKKRLNALVRTATQQLYNMCWWSVATKMTLCCMLGK